MGALVRQIKRLVRAHREPGAAGLVSQRVEQPSNRNKQDAEREEVVAYALSRCGVLGLTLAAEYLRNLHCFTHATETWRRWMKEADTWMPAWKTLKRTFHLREHHC